MCCRNKCLIVGETGLYAHLIEFDPAATKSHRIPIATANLKVKAQNGIPILLKISEAAFNLEVQSLCHQSTRLGRKDTLWTQ